MIVEQALSLILGRRLEEDEATMRTFFHHVAALQCVHIDALTEQEKLVFFVNLYHTMILHAFLLFGAPTSSLKWAGFFNSNAYAVGDDIFSIAELEHNILRANMSYPSQLLSRFVLPKSHYRFGLKLNDYRLNFALNCGAMSNPKSVIIYRVDRLEHQLNRAAMLYLGSASVSFKTSRDLLVSLPRICQWYAEDFGTQEQLLRKIEPFLEESERRKLAACWDSASRRFDMKCVSVRYLEYNFQCQTLVRDDAL